MSTSLSGPRLADEAAFFKRYLANLAQYPITYDDDYVTPPEKRPRRMPVLALEVAPPPMDEGEEGEASGTAAAAIAPITLTIKSLKPSLSFPVQAHLTDSVAQLKATIASTPASSSSSSSSSLPAMPVESQRLLLKGKALTDSKLLKEYDEFKEGATVTLVIKAGAIAASAAAPSASSGTPPTPALTVTEDTASTPRAVRDTDMAVPFAIGPGPSTASSNDVHTALTSTSFWEKIRAVCREQLPKGEQGDEVTLAFLHGVASRLSAGEIAKVQDALGIDAMGGSRA